MLADREPISILMRAIAYASALIAASFVFALGAVAQDAPQRTPPEAVAAAAANAGIEPGKVTIGIYVNDIQDIDFKTNSYVVDLYLWMRWASPSADPVKSVEFMNIFDPESQLKTVLLDAPKAMPDGSKYNIIRYQGRFSKKFRLERYPFDTQKLDFIIEDTVAAASEQTFVADLRAITINPKLSLPGYRIGAPAMAISDYTYPTDFGDLAVASSESYSRAVVSVPISRPMFTLAIKTFGPILLIVICATLVFFIHPRFVEGRIGLAITALLTLVALQFTAAASLPDADYFTMLDKLYMLSYGFIIASLMRVVAASWEVGRDDGDGARIAAVAGSDRWWGVALLILYAASASLISSWVLTR